MGQMTYELRGLTVGYGKGKHTHVVARDIQATLSSGSLVCLVGRNGVGKSTLLRTLAFFHPPLAGDVFLDGRPLSAYSHQALAETVSVVLTERGDLDNLTVSDVVGMGRTPYTNFFGTLRDDDRRIVADAIEAVGLTSLAGKKMSCISDGERQKVMIAKALAQQTPIIILDEPTAFLDYPSKAAILNLLRRLAHEHDKLVLLSTHDLDVAVRIADDIWLMDDQGLTPHATTADLLALDFKDTGLGPPRHFRSS